MRTRFFLHIAPLGLAACSPDPAVTSSDAGGTTSSSAASMAGATSMAGAPSAAGSASTGAGGAISNGGAVSNGGATSAGGLASNVAGTTATNSTSTASCSDSYVAITSFLQDFGDLAVINTPVTQSGPPTTAMAGNYTTTTTCYDGYSHPSPFPVVNPNDSVLWPGSIVQGDSVATGSLNPVPISDRMPLGLSITSIVDTATGTATVTEPTLSTVTAAAQSIVKAAYGSSVSFSLEVDQASDETALAAKLGLNVSGLTWSAGASLSTDWRSSVQHVYVRLQQKYFSIAVDNPNGVRGLLGPCVTVDELKSYVGVGSPIGYIDSVTYGRQFVLVYTTSSTNFDLHVAVNAAYNGGIDVTADSSLTFNQKMASTTVQALSLGGNASDAIAVATDLSKLQAFLTNGAVFSATNTGVPIGYTVRYVANAKLMALNNQLKYCETTRSLISCITNVHILDGTTSDGDYAVMSNDLNKGASGDYISLSYKKGVPSDGCVTKIGFTEHTGTNLGSVIGTDLNRGAGGDYIYLTFSNNTSDGQPIQSLYITSSGSSSPSAPAGYSVCNWMDGTAGNGAADLNRGAGGDFIYLYTSTSN